MGLAQDHEATHRRVFAANAHRTAHAQPERAAQIGAGGLTDQDAAHRCRVFQTSRDVDCVAHDGERAFALGADRASEHHAGVDADPHLELAADLLA